MATTTQQLQRERQARSQQPADREREARRQRESQGNARQTGPDRQRAEALIVLELSHGASLAAVKAAHRRLVKCHHPDMGGDAEAFRRINAAYQLLIA
jgi:DnaJ-domain-containing protein 1